MAKTVCMVCTGNTCRSPMAEALLKRMLADAGRTDIRVCSAGTRAMDGLGASPESRAVMREFGLSLEGHRSARLTRELCANADMILAMEAGHVREVLDRHAAGGDKVHTLRGYAAGVYGFCGRGYDVRDPFGGSREEYKACAIEIQALLAVALPRICAQLGGETS